MIRKPPIMPALIEWHTITDADHKVYHLPFSKQFNDIYYSTENGLAEARHLFLQGNHLPQRLSALQPFEHFCIGELGFGTGLNVLAVWHLWRQVRPYANNWLHIVTTEKHPLNRADLMRALSNWPDLAALSEQLLAQYPPLMAGCHRLIFAQDNVSLDLWLGDAADCLAQVAAPRPLNAWFLDGFTPVHNPDLWQTAVMQQVQRLSGPGTTLSTFSVAGVVKRELVAHGFNIQKQAGFGQKRAMLTAYRPPMNDLEHQPQADKPSSSNFRATTKIAIIGAGIAGLSTAYALALRGFHVDLYDQQYPLAGASGNPRALLIPRLTLPELAHEHFHTLGWLSTVRWWKAWQHTVNGTETVIELTSTAYDAPGGLALATPKNSLDLSRLQYDNNEILQPLNPQQASTLLGQPVQSEGAYFPAAAVINPFALARQVMGHAAIAFRQATITRLIEQASTQGTAWQLAGIQNPDTPVHLVEVLPEVYSHVVVCTAEFNQTLLPFIEPLQAIRGQVSWFKIDAKLAQYLPKLPLTYGGYCLRFEASKEHQPMPYFLLGASFIRQNPPLANINTSPVTDEEHKHNFGLLQEALPACASWLPPINDWLGRAATRVQTRDYLPVVGETVLKNVFIVTALGSKGFSFAPLCAEIISAAVTQTPAPVSQNLLKALHPKRLYRKIKQNH